MDRLDIVTIPFMFITLLMISVYTFFMFSAIKDTVRLTKRDWGKLTFNNYMMIFASISLSVVCPFGWTVYCFAMYRWLV